MLFYPIICYFILYHVKIHYYFSILTKLLVIQQINPMNLAVIMFISLNFNGMSEYEKQKVKNLGINTYSKTSLKIY